MLFFSAEYSEAGYSLLYEGNSWNSCFKEVLTWKGLHAWQNYWREFRVVELIPYLVKAHSPSYCCGVLSRSTDSKYTNIRLYYTKHSDYKRCCLACSCGSRNTAPERVLIKIVLIPYLVKHTLLHIADTQCSILCTCHFKTSRE